ncbi:16S rRNA (adenine(1518)-N(6)/adenine(1519)-N(6))-dimethyltransferase RsmA [Elongatibacter sediminis]|uniref:Ribosomal RNA small subunit methyltransferase A n=1 Tax=Elongatibacter sediminis TaxID=3119006 RepID=A0AAW9RG11_9GAMM
MKHRARKRFSQNFLKDPAVVARIAASIDAGPDQTVVEIGPGHGALTRPLLASGAALHLIEIDRDLAAELRTLLRDHPQAVLHEADALDMDFGTLAANGPLRVVGNLPYNISTPLLFHLLQWSEIITDMHFMLQREVVQRMAAGPGGRDRGRLSVMCQLQCRVTRLFDVPPEAFIPAPRVHSSVVRLEPHESPPVVLESRAAFGRVVSQAFSQRRKTLRNSLRQLLTSEQISAAGCDPGARPETLTLEQFAALSRRVDATVAG